MAIFDPSRCLNCGSGLSPEQIYCGKCGQKCGAGRLTIRQLCHEFLHALTHVDRSVLSLLWPLLVRPGYVARDYIVGKRKRYFGPLSWLVVIVGLVSAEIALSGFHVVIADNPGALEDFLQRHVNVAFLIQVPVLALFCRILFWRDGFNSAEFLVLAAYAASVRTLLFGLVLVPLELIFHPGHAGQVYGAYVSLFVWFVYFWIRVIAAVRGRSCHILAEGRRRRCSHTSRDAGCGIVDRLALVTVIAVTPRQAQ
jgi:hypothetical protein